MRLRLIRLLAILVALVVPLQGMAVVAAGQCMAFGHHESLASDESHSHADDGHTHADDGDAAHSHADEAGSKVDVDETGGNDAHCGPCTACCASASIAGPAGISIPSSPSSAPYVFSQFPPIGVQPDGLDRPPLAL